MTPASLGSSTESGLSSSVAAERLRQDGPNDVPERKPNPVLRLARKFWGLSAWMIELIVMLSYILGKTADLWIALALLVVNAVLRFVEEQHASTAVAALRSHLQVTARVLRDGSWAALSARDLVRGDVVRVRAGDFIPADLQIVDGGMLVDQSMLTGESREVGKGAGESLHSGSIVRQGEATAVVVATGARTYFGRTTQLVESAHPKLHVETVVARVVRWLFSIVGVLVLVTVVVSISEGGSLTDVLPLSLVLLMSAVPVALPVMFTVSMAVGSLELARRGVLVVRLSAAEDAANMDVLCADKTGTLTLNRLSIVGLLPQPGFTADDVLRDGALASNAANQDPIDMAFLRAAREQGLLDGKAKTIAFVPFSPASRRTVAQIEESGRAVRVMKGALRTLTELAGWTPPQVSALEERLRGATETGVRALAVARAETDGPVSLVGVALLSDPPRPDSRQLIDKLRSLGVAVKMLTGDALPVAREVARELGLGDVVRAPDLRGQPDTRAGALAQASSGFAEVFPEDKFLVVQRLQAAGHVVGMTGDGVNDAPALRQAEVGIAVAGASDVAKGAASVVLTSEGLGSIVDLVTLGRAIYQRVLTWIINKVSQTIFQAGFVVVAFLVTGKFVISALGMILLVFMTDFVKIALSTDRVRPSQRPETWNIGPLVSVGALIGFLMLAESLGLLAIGWRSFGLGASGGLLRTFSFQLLLFFAVFSIVSIRERQGFWSSRPSAILALALAADACAGVPIGVFGFAELRPIPLWLTAAIIAYAGVCSLGINDLVKAAAIRRSSAHGSRLSD